MWIRIPEAVSCQLLQYGLFEVELTAYMLRTIKVGDMVVDVGAHYGYFSLLAASLVGERGEVHAFEPTPSTFGMLSRNVSTLPGVTVNQNAVWAETRDLKVLDFGWQLSAFNSAFAPRIEEQRRYAGSPRAVVVRAVSLDDYCAEIGLRPTFVKVDAESAEHHIVRGMPRLLNQVRPLVTLEVGDFDIPNVASSSELVRKMLSYDYAALQFSKGNIVRHQVRDSYRYNNLLFAPREHPLLESVQP